MSKICFETGIDRLNWTVEPGIDDALEFILTNTGSRQGCLLELKSYYYAKSLLSWFKDGDLEQLRQHAYTSAKLYRLYYQRANSVWQGAFCHFMALISDHEPLINWHIYGHLGFSKANVLLYSN